MIVNRDEQTRINDDRFIIPIMIEVVLIPKIGIRKVHGAEVNSIIAMMLRSFLILILISIVIASVASYFFAKDWLQSFVYRTDIRWVSFVLAAVITIVITIITVGLHTLRASSVNPAISQPRSPV